MVRGWARKKKKREQNQLCIKMQRERQFIKGLASMIKTVKRGKKPSLRGRRSLGLHGNVWYTKSKETLA